jgi:hypothetical protein
LGEVFGTAEEGHPVVEAEAWTEVFAVSLAGVALFG